MATIKITEEINAMLRFDMVIFVYFADVSYPMQQKLPMPRKIKALSLNRSCISPF
jgi:hypothetical protein